jgi:lipopolysaccharide export system protein LptC
VAAVLGRLTAFFPLALLASLAALTFWLDRMVQQGPQASQAASRHDPDYMVDKLNAARTNEAGVVVYTLAAERMVHFPDDDTTVLKQPRFVSLRSKQAPVTITAREGLVSSNGENVYLKDDVKVTRAAYAGRSEMVVRTTYLHIIPDDNIAKTDKPVTITDAATIVNAVGLELNNETHVLKLFSQVRGTYDPNLAPKKDASK